MRTRTVRIWSVALVLLLAGCSAATPPATSPAVPSADLTAGLPTPDVDTPTPWPTIRVNPYESIDEVRVSQLMDEGLTESEALLLALTQVEAEVIGPQQYRILARFPTGNTADMTVTLQLDQLGDPEAEQPLTIVHRQADEGFAFRLEYFVAYDTIPADVLEQIRGQARRPGPPMALAGGTLAGLMLASQASGLAVVVEAIVSEYESSLVDDFVSFLDKRLGAKGGLDNLLNTIKAGLSIADAALMSQELAGLMNQLDELEECARNPTNELTRREYERNPTAKQRVLGALGAARIDIKSNVAVMYVALLNATASGLLKVPGLSYVVGAGTAWSMETLRQVNARLLAELRDAIPKCQGYQFEFSGFREGYRSGFRAEIEYHYWGLLCPHAETWQIWESVDGKELDQYVEQSPSDDPQAATFDDNGQLLSVTWFGFTDDSTAYGTTFTLMPGVNPVEVKASIPFTVNPVEIIEPVTEADGSIRSCEEQ